MVPPLSERNSIPVCNVNSAGGFHFIAGIKELKITRINKHPSRMKGTEGSDTEEIETKKTGKVFIPKDKKMMKLWFNACNCGKKGWWKNGKECLSKLNLKIYQESRQKATKDVDFFSCQRNVYFAFWYGDGACKASRSALISIRHGYMYFYAMFCWSKWGCWNLALWICYSQYCIVSIKTGTHKVIVM